MAGNGPAPSPHRRRRNADTYAGVQKSLVDDGQLRGPALEGSWRADTRAWYDTWRWSPQAAVFLATDWARLRLMAPLVDSYFDRPTDRKLAEIRQNESLLGATLVDRLKARMWVDEPEAEKPAAGVTALDEYRNRLSG